MSTQCGHIVCDVRFDLQFKVPQRFYLLFSPIIMKFSAKGSNYICLKNFLVVVKIQGKINLVT